MATCAKSIHLVAITLAICAVATVAPAQSARLPAPIAQDVALVHADANIPRRPDRLEAILAQQSGSSSAKLAIAMPLAWVGRRTGHPFPSLVHRTVRTPIALDRPDVFGSIALPVARTSLDGRWRRVAFAGVSGEPKSFAAALRSRAPLDRIEAVNRYVNAHVAFSDDARGVGAADHWARAADTLHRGRGDCEDYAIAKLQMLRAAGLSDKDLYLVIVKDVVRRSDHAVLVVRAEGRMLLLDNGTDRIADAAKAQDYFPVFSYSAGQAWTHGYPRTVKFAQATPPASAMIARRR